MQQRLLVSFQIINAWKYQSSNLDMVLYSEFRLVMYLNIKQMYNPNISSKWYPDLSWWMWEFLGSTVNMVFPMSHTHMHPIFYSIYVTKENQAQLALWLNFLINHWVAKDAKMKRHFFWREDEKALINILRMHSYLRT
jgi:hypothetical protein